MKVNLNIDELNKLSKKVNKTIKNKGMKKKYYVLFW